MLQLLLQAAVVAHQEALQSIDATVVQAGVGLSLGQAAVVLLLGKAAQVVQVAAQILIELAAAVAEQVALEQMELFQ